MENLCLIFLSLLYIASIPSTWLSMFLAYIRNSSPSEVTVIPFDVRRKIIIPREFSSSLIARLKLG